MFAFERLHFRNYILGIKKTKRSWKIEGKVVEILKELYVFDKIQDETIVQLLNN